MANFDNTWYNPDNKETGINKGKPWTPYSDSLSIYDMNKIVSDIKYLKQKIDEILAKIGG